MVQIKILEERGSQIPGYNNSTFHIRLTNSDGSSKRVSIEQFVRCVSGNQNDGALIHRTVISLKTDLESSFRSGDRSRINSLERSFEMKWNEYLGFSYSTSDVMKSHSYDGSVASLASGYVPGARNAAWDLHDRGQYGIATSAVNTLSGRIGIPPISKDVIEPKNADIYYLLA